MQPLIIRLLPALFILIAMAGNAADQPTDILIHSSKTNTLSATLEQAPLGEVLTELSRQTGISVAVNPASADLAITREFHDLPLHEGIKQLLSEQSYVLIYAQQPSQEHGPAVAAIHVLEQDVPAPPPTQEISTAIPDLSRSTSAETEALLQGLWSASSPEAQATALQAIAEHDLARFIDAITAALQGIDSKDHQIVLKRLEAVYQSLPPGLLSEITVSHPDPIVRMNALALLNELGQEALHTLHQTLPVDTQEQVLEMLQDFHNETLANATTAAMTDDNAEVRSTALESLDERVGEQPLPLEMLTTMALTDPLPELRMSALELLVAADQASALEPLNQAQHDSDPRVSKLALELLAELQSVAD